MNWSRSWSKVCDSDRIVPSPSHSASGPWCWVGRSVMFLFDCWLAGWPFISNPGYCTVDRSCSCLIVGRLIDHMSRTENATKQPAFANPETVFVRKQCCNNPVNHRVFERKLRPKPSGRGHVCLGVTNRRPPSSRGYGTEADLPCVTARVRRSDPKALDDPKSSMRPQSGEASSATDRAQVPWKGAPERVRAPSCPDPVAPRGAVYESGCLGMQPQSGGKFRPRLNMGERPIANKYREVKMKRTLKRESKSA
ncbi:hypothetical protein YC2023_108422 [Brassica napus]